MRVGLRKSAAAVTAALSLVVAPAALAGELAAPADDATVATAAPLFLVGLADGEVHARVDVASDEAMHDPVGSCVPVSGPEGTGCRLAVPLAAGDYYWQLSADTAICDGDAGQYCSFVTRLAGPALLHVAAAVESVPPAPAAPAPTAPAVSPLIVPGRSIGGVALGMSESQAAGLAGRPEALRAPAGRASGTLRRLRTRGGTLDVVLRAGRVAAVATTSPWYRTAAGLRVGVRPSAPRSYRRCGGALAAAAPGARTVLVLRRGSIVAIRVESVAGSATLHGCSSTSSP